jgi:hypothetical protein
MKEIFFTFYQLFFIFILFLFPFHFIKEKFRFLKIYNFFDLICLNIIIQFTLYLILSFFIPNISLLINLIGIFSLILLSVNFSKIKLLIKNNYFLLLLIIVFLILVLCNFFYIASYFRLQWDGVAHWFWKVQSFHQGANLGNFQNLPHPAYPHLGTFLWANFWNVSFVDYEYFGRFYYAYIYLAAVFSILYPIKSKYLIIIISLVSFLIFDGFLLGGYQEFLIFFFITFSARLFYLLKYHNYLINNFLFFFILTLNLLIWSKQEGILYACILSFVYLICFKTHLIKKITLLSFLLIFIALYFYLNIIFKNSGFFHEPVTNNFERLRDFNLFIDSFIYISLHLIKSLISRPIIILSLFFLCYYKFLRKESFFKLDFYTLFFIFNIFLIYGIFFHTRYALTSMVPQVLGRFLLQTSGFYLISFVFLFNYFSKNEK